MPFRIHLPVRTLTRPERAPRWDVLPMGRPHYGAHTLGSRRSLNTRFTLYGNTGH
ncbi:hypothetical protein [Herbidospora daliensis]|uniref:hypothetical protein n=1 Tax=Herbidospora daliensis TaxID=295585 RepID=UPI000AC2E08F|nr:hypothetical protein [Herbidospora daliensis]